MKGSVQKSSGSKMKRAAPNQKILDSNAISLKNKHIKRQQKFNRNSNIIHKYRRMQKREQRLQEQQSETQQTTVQVPEVQEKKKKPVRIFWKRLRRVKNELFEQPEEANEDVVVNASSDEEEENETIDKVELQKTLLREMEQSKKEKKERKMKSIHKPDMFKEARKKADDYKKQQEQKKIERELQEKELKHKLKEKKKIAHKLTLKTSKGQPLMKYQSQYLLEKIQKSLKQ